MYGLAAHSTHCAPHQRSLLLWPWLIALTPRFVKQPGAERFMVTLMRASELALAVDHLTEMSHGKALRAASTELGCH